jgi:hypothetical protein
MMNSLRRLRFGTALTGVLAVAVVACQQTPVPSSPSADALQNSPKPEATTQPPVEIAKIPEAKPEIVPEVVTPPILRLLPESIIATPLKELASPKLQYNTMVSTRSGDGAQNSSWQFRRTREGTIVGFEFSNHGGNRVLAPRRDAPKNQFFTRDFQFRFDERARQDIHLLVTDWVASRDRQFRLSELMITLLHFFPRNYLPAIVNFNGKNLVTLPTGEEVEFNAQTHEILNGVLTEAPVDLNPDRGARNFPRIEYGGKGVIVRANARGSDPRIGTTATITTAAPLAACDGNTKCNQCQMPSRELWNQNGAVRFKFSTDQEFDRFLLSRCQFGLPKTETGYALAPASK